MTKAELPIKTGIHPEKTDSEPADPTFLEFLNAIDMPHVAEILTPGTPLVYISMEYYSNSLGIWGQGGLGVLAADIMHICEANHIPMIGIGEFYAQEVHQTITDGRQTETRFSVTPEERGFVRHDMDVRVRTVFHDNIPLAVYSKQFGSTQLFTMYHPESQELYAGGTNGNHRLFQEIINGFGAHQIQEHLGIRPPYVQLNEAPTVFAAIARVDALCREGMTFEAALTQVRKQTIYTNHTLVQAVESPFSQQQFEEFVYPNIQNEAVKAWIGSQFRDGQVKLSTIALALADKKTGVSQLHARVSNTQYTDADGNAVNFEPITNGIADRWVSPAILELFESAGVIDTFHLVRPGFEQGLDAIPTGQLVAIKKTERTLFRDFLRTRVDQNGETINIPDEALIIDWTRRFADYKRPEQLFHDPERLAKILEDGNAHLVIGGKAHPSDGPMKDVMAGLFELIRTHEILSRRVHYVVDYNEPAGAAIGRGSDISINNPIVGKEACGTSWEKKIYNLAILGSTNDGGVADIQPPPCFVITGTTYDEEAASLYTFMEWAIRITRATDHDEWGEVVKKQLKGYLPIASGSEMMARYLRYMFPKTA